jgi:hypothetical protein
MRLPTSRKNDSTVKTATRRASTWAFALFAALTLSACGQLDIAAVEPSATSEPQSVSLRNAGELLEALVSAAGPQDAAHALLALPAPVELSVVQVPNRHTRGQLDSIQTWVYPELSLEVYVVGSSATELLKSAHVARPGTEFRGLQVGRSTADARRALEGAALLFRSEAVETYMLAGDAGAPAQVTLQLGERQLEAFTVHAYLD